MVSSRLVRKSRRKLSLVYLIRLWPAGNGGEPAWRASVESVGCDKKQVFASLDDLFAFLREQVVRAGPPKTGKEG